MEEVFQILCLWLLGMNCYRQTDDCKTDKVRKTVVKSLIEEIGFARFDGGSLRDGGRKQQPGSPICNTPMTMERARQIFDSIKDWSTSHKR